MAIPKTPKNINTQWPMNAVYKSTLSMQNDYGGCCNIIMYKTSVLRNISHHDYYVYVYD